MVVHLLLSSVPLFSFSLVASNLEMKDWAVVEVAELDLRGEVNLDSKIHCCMFCLEKLLSAALEL